MAAGMTAPRRNHATIRLRERGLIAMAWNGAYEPTQAGRDFLDDIDLLRELARKGATPGRTGRRDDGPTRRPASRRKGNR